MTPSLPTCTQSHNTIYADEDHPARTAYIGLLSAAIFVFNIAVSEAAAFNNNVAAAPRDVDHFRLLLCAAQLNTVRCARYSRIEYCNDDKA